MRDADPALRAQLRALTGEIARLDALRKRIADKKSEEAAAQQALATAARAPRSRGGAPQRRTAGNVAAAEH